MEIESQELHKKHRKYLPEPIFDCISEEMLVSKNFLSIIKCPICFHLFTIPVTLLCGHSFCKGCISRCLGCPICKKKFLTLPEKSIILSDLVLSENLLPITFWLRYRALQHSQFNFGNHQIACDGLRKHHCEVQLWQNDSTKKLFEKWWKILF